MVIITGGIDLSVGSLIALSAVLAARFIRDYAGAEQASVLGMTLAGIAAVLICGLIGAFSGGMITVFGIPPFIVTLAMMLVGSGLAYLLAAGQSIYQLPDSFVWLGRGEGLWKIPNAVLLMLILYGAAHVLMSQMRLGRHLYAVGGNREAARLSGVPVWRVLMFAYIASALLAGLGGVTGDPLSGLGFVWLSLTDRATRYPVAIVHEARRQLEIIMATKTMLITSIVDGDTAAKRLAVFLGFQVLNEDEGAPAETRYGRRRLVEFIEREESIRHPVGTGYVIPMSLVGA